MIILAERTLKNLRSVEVVLFIILDQPLNYSELTLSMAGVLQQLSKDLTSQLAPIILYFVKLVETVQKFTF